MDISYRLDKITSYELRKRNELSGLIHMSVFPLLLLVCLLIIPLSTADELVSDTNNGLTIFEHAGAFNEKSARFSSELDPSDCQNFTLPIGSGKIRVYDFKSIYSNENHLNPEFNGDSIYSLQGISDYKLIGRSFEDLDSGVVNYYEMRYDSAGTDKIRNITVCWKPDSSLIQNRQIPYKYAMSIVYYQENNTTMKPSDSKNAPVIGYSGSGIPYYDDGIGSQTQECPPGYKCAPDIKRDPNSLGILFEEPKTDWDIYPFSWSQRIK